MANKLPWHRNSRRLTILLLAVTAPPAATLIWLGAQLLTQDQALLAQRDLERRQTAAQSVARSLERSLEDAEHHVAEGPVPDGGVRILVSPNGVTAEPRDRVAWVPATAFALPDDQLAFEEAERFEFQHGDARAAALYEQASRSPKPAVRAGALLRLARLHRSQKRWSAALSAYGQLAAIGGVAVEGAPADLQALRASCAVLEESARSADLRANASDLERDFVAGRWVLDRPAWELTAADLWRWTGRTPAISPARRAFSAASERLWNERGQRLPPRRLLVVDDTTLTALSRAHDGVVSVLLIPGSVLTSWTDGAVERAALKALRVTVVGADGTTLAGPPAANGEAVVKMPSAETGLPWTVLVHPADTAPLASELASRQRMFSVGLAAILLLFAGGSYFLWRVMQRELVVARLQTDFVSAVSHEFRTPLTSMRHVTELLQEDDEVPADRRRTFYEALARNTERLHRLVESLLDFARMEGGRKPYDLRLIDASALVAEVVGEFRKEVAPRGFTIDLDARVEAAHIRADGSSLVNALWNLLDNAVKYSGDSRTVHVSVTDAGGRVAIAVRDHGLGIPPHERKEIFGRFVRGEYVTRLGIRGTGLGLTMVSHIVQAHGGRIDVDSAEGVGSTFAIVIPAQEQPDGGRYVSSAIVPGVRFQPDRES